MTRLPALKPKKLISVLERQGFVFYRQKGSHRIYVKGVLMVVVPFHAKDLKRGTLAKIIEDAGLTEDEFKDLL
jgi:predicted RNA binding protein YcfA (HicA-like mRNA interferase family)